MATFTGVELYRSTTDLSIKTRTWCDTNAILLYSGTAETYSDSGLTSGELYYYKVFSVYTEDGETVYSNGVATTCITGTIPLVVTAIANTSNTVQLTFNVNMADPTDKEDEFSVSVGGGSGGDYQEWENYPDSPLLTADYPYQVITTNFGNIYLYMSPYDIRMRDSSKVWGGSTSSGSMRSIYDSASETWGTPVLFTEVGIYNLATSLNDGFIEANSDIYTDNTLTTVVFSQTTLSSTTLTITSITQPSSKVYQFNISETMLDTDTITATYTKGTVESTAGVDLEDFSETVTNSI